MLRPLKPASESRIVGLIAAVQFVNVLDFMMVMPLGPDFAKALAIPSSHLGWIGGSYTAAASVAGFIGFFLLDRWDRKKALMGALFGLTIATLLGGLAHDFTTLLMARVVAGLFGGPAASISLSIVADSVPLSRRGRAIGVVMGAFSVASIIGVPAGLEAARLGGWRFPFFALSALALATTALIWIWVPSMRAHLELARVQTVRDSLRILKRREVRLAFAIVSASMIAGFIMIPNFSAFFQYNLGFPRERLGLLYLAGGLVSLVMMRVAGKSIDRSGATRVIRIAAGVLILTLIFGYVIFPPWIPLLVAFVGFMTGMSVRGVAMGTLASRVPRAEERAGYMSFQSAVQHLSSAIGAFLSSVILTEGEGFRLVGMPKAACASIALTFLVPFWASRLERRLGEGRRDTGLGVTPATRASDLPTESLSSP